MLLRVAGLSLGLLLAGEASGQSFDCTKAGTQAEDLVCSDADLGALDEWLAVVFEVALRSFPEEEVPTLRAYQRGWIKGRDECWKAQDVRACVEDSYRSRIVELQIQSGQVASSSRTVFACDGTDLPLFAVFYRETAQEAVVLTHGDDQVIAFLGERDGTAERFGVTLAEFEEATGTVRADWTGKELRCRRR